MKRLRSKLTYSNVISTLALFLVLAGGTAFAATQMLPKNSVGPKQLKKGAVTPAKLSTTTKSQLTGAKGATGAQGPQGIPGAQGAPATALWAEVSKTASLIKGSGATGASEPFGEGTYQVDFNRDVSACTYQATSSGFPGAIVLVEPRDKRPASVFVETTKVFGGPPTAGQFSLAVFC
jgi:hypothetical protein